MSDDEAEMAALRKNQRFQESAAHSISEAKRNAPTHEEALPQQPIDPAITLAPSNKPQQQVSYLAQFRKKQPKL